MNNLSNYIETYTPYSPLTQTYYPHKINNEKVNELTEINRIKQKIPSLIKYKFKMLCNCSMCDATENFLKNYKRDVSLIYSTLHKINFDLVKFSMHNNLNKEALDVIIDALYFGVCPDSYYQIVDVMGEGIRLKQFELHYRYNNLFVYDENFCFTPIKLIPIKLIISPPTTGKTTVTNLLKDKVDIHDIDDAYNFFELFNMVGDLGPNFQFLKNAYVLEYFKSKFIHVQDRQVIVLIHSYWDAENIFELIPKRNCDLYTIVRPKSYYENIVKGNDDANNIKHRASITLSYYDNLISSTNEFNKLIIVNSDDEYVANVFMTLNAESSFTNRYVHEQNNNIAFKTLMYNRINEVEKTKREIAVQLLKQAINAKSISTIMKLLSYLFPETHVDLMLRTRMSYKAIAMLLIQKESEEYIDKLLIIYLNSSGNSIHFCANILLVILFVPDLLSYYVKLSELGYFCNGIKSITSELKEIHNIVRRLGFVPLHLLNYYSGGYDKLLYNEQLVGRYFGYAISLDDTIEQRQKFIRHCAFSDSTNNSSNTYDAYIREEINLATACTSKLRLENQYVDKTFSNWRAKYMILGASGTVGQGKKDLEHLESTTGANKMIWLSEISDEKILNIYKEEVTTFITCTLKLELGKLRQLLPGPIVHWLGETIILETIEKTILREHFEIMLEKTPSEMLGKIKKRIDDCLHSYNVGIDYKDFNITHDHRHMQAIYKQIQTRLQQMGGTGDFDGKNYPSFVVLVIDFIIKCMDNLFARAEGGDGIYEHVIRGLWTGWRSTMFFNILLNYLYMKVCKRSNTALFGNPLITTFESMGDDVNAQANNEIDAVFSIVSFKLQDHEVSDLKQLIGTRIEFLRVFYERGILQGSTVRAICGFGSSDTQAPVYNDSLSTLRGTNEAIHLLIRRSTNEKIGEMLRDVLIELHTKAPFGMYQYGLKDKRWAYIVEKDGGLGMNRYGRPSLHLTQKAKNKFKVIKERSFTEISKIKNVKAFGIKHAVHNTSSRMAKVGMTLDSMILKNVMYEQTYKPLRDNETNEKALQVDEIITVICNCNYNHSLAYQTEILTISPDLEHLVNDHLMTIDNMPYNIAMGLPIVDLEQLLEEGFNAVLLEAAVAPALIHTFRDQASGEKLKPTEILARVATRDPQVKKQLDKALMFYNSHYINAYLEQRTHFVHDVGGVIPPEFINYVRYIHAKMTSNITDLTIEKMNYKLRRVNLCIIRAYFNNKLHHKYKL